MKPNLIIIQHEITTQIHHLNLGATDKYLPQPIQRRNFVV
jgi:hypothetical protein